MSDEEEVVVDPAAAALAGVPECRVRQNDLPDHLWDKVRITLKEALAAHKMEKDIANYIKTKIDNDPDFNELPGKGPYQCVVGKSFSAAITHEASHICFFDIANTRETVLLFKSLSVQV
mmetsp:Transcript_24180/g.60877  ORF Transcript_24180/g.60877 Transcript_24180/m.60877 type:complete len:119 (-) Transcript_24180:481-837(-)|eukprot:CAMPEP_0178992584 /NCGR_PEP_ID=MMETSP0795-20121207/6196_1 /TAXON_ID=88552 /ORGANISM="Amoebophrya sp., Strain Ameob2" /LENGTH=118 /DNA_ID=CAMNT_0020684483 /DNA_START=159 /DNA_END=515 /DNA_ORIENTATION=+